MTMVMKVMTDTLTEEDICEDNDNDTKEEVIAKKIVIAESLSNTIILFYFKLYRGNIKAKNWNEFSGPQRERACVCVRVCSCSRWRLFVTRCWRFRLDSK